MNMEHDDVSGKSRHFNASSLPGIVEQLNQESEDTQRAVFTLLIKEEASEVLKYNAYRALIQDVLTSPVAVDQNIILDLVNDALELTKMLSKKYDLYINEHAAFLSKNTLQKHQKSYQNWINSIPSASLGNKNRTWMDWFKAYFILEGWTAWFKAELTTERMNPRRLYFLRERRLFVLLVPIIKDFGNYRSWILWADAYVAPFLVSLGAVFFLPRLIFNVRTVFDNVFDHGKMKSEAKMLDSWTRFMVQWKRLWPQIMNDVGWGLSGLLMCFVFIGAWQPLAIYLSVSMQFYDVLMASIRMYIDFDRLNTLTEQYDKWPSDPTFPSGNQYKELHLAYCRHLKKGMQREKTLLYLALTNASVLFFAVCLSLPFMVALNPLMPIIGSVIAIIMTIINFQSRDYLNTPDSITLEDSLNKYPRLNLGHQPSASATNLVNSEHPLNVLVDSTLVSQEPTLEPILIRRQSSGYFTPISFFSHNIFNLNSIGRTNSCPTFNGGSTSPSPPMNESALFHVIK